MPSSTPETPDPARPRVRLSELSEKQLLAELWAGSRPAADELVERTYEMIYASLYKMTGGDSELAADLTQDTYARAWRSLDGFSGKSKLSTWLYRIAYNTFLNHVRRPAPVRSFEEGEQEAVFSDAPNQAETALERQQAEHLRRAVLGLPDELRLTVTARFWGGFSVREIAQMQGLSTVGIRKRLKRAYRVLELVLEVES